MKNDSKETGLRLLKKGKQGIFRMIFSRSGLTLVLLAVQVLFLFSIFHWFEAFIISLYAGECWTPCFAKTIRQIE